MRGRPACVAISSRDVSRQRQPDLPAGVPLLEDAWRQTIRKDPAQVRFLPFPRGTIMP
jgi:hypothetical protein